MRLLLDLQCVQSTSAVRGIGRYALSLAQALVSTAGPEDAVEVLLNGGDDANRLLRARSALESFLPARAVHVFDAPWPWHHAPSAARRAEAEAVRAAAVASLRPDVLLVGSLFEGDKENVLSVDGRGVPTAALLYDLIPAADPGTYLLGPGADSYWRRFDELRRVDLLLSISRYSGRQAEQLVGEGCPPVAPIWGGPYPSGLFQDFEDRAVPPPPQLPDRYLLSVGGDHPRKNLDRLVQAWSEVPAASRQGTALVVACRLNVGTVRRLRRLASRSGLTAEELVLTGEVSEHVLALLYRGARGFVFPSTEEGLGLPPLEAMAAGCPTVLSHGSSLSELVDEADAYFDGFDTRDMARAVQRLLDDADFRARLRDAAARATARFTWTATAQLAWEHLRGLADRRAPGHVDVPALGAPDALDRRPAPLLLDELPALPPPGGDVLAAEAELGIRSPLPAGTRTALAPATALVATRPEVARPLLEAGLLDQPLLADVEQVERAAAHDVYREVRERLPAPQWPADLVSALAWPPRWSLERPWPVWLLVSAREVDAEGLRSMADERGAVLVVGAPGAAVLARSVDRVLVDAHVLPELAGDLHRARCLGTEVTVYGDDHEGAPPWATTAPDALAAVRTADATRTTGWPWGSRRG